MPERHHTASHIADVEVPLSTEGSLGTKAKIVDFSDFEHQKENIQPLRRGRSASTLALLYGTEAAAPESTDGGASTPDSLASAARHSLQPTRPLGVRHQDTTASAEHMEIRVSGHLQSQNAQFQAEIAAIDPVETEDPLDVYYRYIQWLFEVFPQATGHQAIIKLVEKPLKLFKEQERYRNDARYVKMWIWYTGLITDGQDAVFQFLVANKIGDSLAILYEEYAKLLESMGKVRQADEIFQLGVARKAQPLARLQRRYVEFQKRVMAQTMRDVEQQQQSEHQSQARSTAPSGGDGPDGGNPHRTMLGTKRTGRSVHSAAANTLPSSQRGLPSQHQSTGTGASRPNSRIAVFSDPEGRASKPSPATSAAHDQSGSSMSSTPWLDIGSDEGRRKENMHETTSWRGQTLEQRRPLPSTGRPPSLAPHAPVIEKFTVFSDEVDSEPTDTQQSLADTYANNSPASVLGPKTADSAAAASSNDLLHSFAAASDDAPKASHGSHDKHKRKTKEKAKEKANAHKNPEKMVMHSWLLFPAGDDIPQCAEEARAKLPKYCFDYDEWCAKENAGLEEQERHRIAAELEEVQKDSQRRAEQGDDGEDEDDDESIEDESVFPGAKGKRLATSSPTINTRAAQEGMLDIWNDLSDSDSDSDSLLGSSSRAKPGKGKHSGLPSSVEDDYQFTMGPVTPNVVPEELSHQPAAIPSSARVSRFEAFLDRDARGAKDENDPPTVVLNSMRTAKRQELQKSKAKATPLATRSQAPALSTASGLRQQATRVLRGIGEESEGEDGDEEPACLMAAIGPKTPLGARMQVFHDSSAGADATQPQTPVASAPPKPLFTPAAAPNASSTPAPLGRRFDVFHDHSTASCGDSYNSSGNNIVEPRSSYEDVGRSDISRVRTLPSSSIKSGGALYSTPARGMSGGNGESSGFSSMHRSTSGSRYPQTPGFATNASGYASVSGAEFTSLTGFTGVSSIGGPTSSLDHDHTDPVRFGDSDGGEDDLHTGEVAQTPMRKRLSMAAKDLRSITPRFPKMPMNEEQLQAFDEDDDDDDDDDDDEDDDEDDPHTENIAK
ncbi:hypothetical protein GQ54DRAFT_340475 [Martensiomyces pterosporus]|nr:hypothetical protein GQ54DRAFT_340475 [Martensiomyces pterosporus]